jgi:hypothetical protein
MKTYKNLFPRICAYDNLYYAWRAAASGVVGARRAVPRGVVGPGRAGPLQRRRTSRAARRHPTTPTQQSSEE